MSATAVAELREDIAQFWVTFKESERLREEERKEAARLREEECKKTERLFQEVALAHQKTEETIDRLADNIEKGVGGLRTTIGRIVEMVLLPGLSAKMNELGHLFTKSSFGDVFRRPDGSALTEVDLYLENCDEVMVVEAKTRFNDTGVKDLLDRVQKLRTNGTLTGVAGKTIYAAAAGVDFTPEARQMIEANGIYLVEVNEENDKIKVKPLSIDKAGKW